MSLSLSMHCDTMSAAEPLKDSPPMSADSGCETSPPDASSAYNGSDVVVIQYRTDDNATTLANDHTLSGATTNHYVEHERNECDANTFIASAFPSYNEALPSFNAVMESGSSTETGYAQGFYVYPYGYSYPFVVNDYLAGCYEYPPFTYASTEHLVQPENNKEGSYETAQYPRQNDNIWNAPSHHEQAFRPRSSSVMDRQVTSSLAHVQRRFSVPNHRVFARNELASKHRSMPSGDSQRTFTSSRRAYDVNFLDYMPGSYGDRRHSAPPDQFWSRRRHLSSEPRTEHGLFRNERHSSTRTAMRRFSVDSHQNFQGSDRAFDSRSNFTPPIKHAAARAKPVLQQYNCYQRLDLPHDCVGKPLILSPDPRSPRSVESQWRAHISLLFRNLRETWLITRAPDGFRPGEDGWTVSKDFAKVRFYCPRCCDGWTSMYGLVVFYFRRNLFTNDGSAQPRRPATLPTRHTNQYSQEHQPDLSENNELRGRLRNPKYNKGSMNCPLENDDCLSASSWVTDSNASLATSDARRFHETRSTEKISGDASTREFEEENDRYGFGYHQEAQNGSVSNSGSSEYKRTTTDSQLHGNETNVARNVSQRLADSRGWGQILYEVSGQKCGRCNPEIFEMPLWYADEAQKVITNLYYAVAREIYGLCTPRPIRTRRLGQPAVCHYTQLCQGCSTGQCKGDLCSLGTPSFSDDNALVGATNSLDSSPVLPEQSRGDAVDWTARSNQRSTYPGLTMPSNTTSANSFTTQSASTSVIREQVSAQVSESLTLGSGYETVTNPVVVPNGEAYHVNYVNAYKRPYASESSNCASANQGSTLADNSLDEDNDNQLSNRFAGLEVQSDGNVGGLLTYCYPPPSMPAMQFNAQLSTQYVTLNHEQSIIPEAFVSGYPVQFAHLAAPIAFPAQVPTQPDAAHPTARPLHGLVSPTGAEVMPSLGVASGAINDGGFVSYSVRACLPLAVPGTVGTYSAF